MGRIEKIVVGILPLILMIVLVPFIPNDYLLTLVYVIIILFSFHNRYEKNDSSVFIFGFIAMTIAEFLFISTGVEVFRRNSLFGIMPLWLPFLWGYSFVVIKRNIKMLGF